MALRAKRISILLVTGILMSCGFGSSVRAEVTYTFAHIAEHGDDADAILNGEIGRAQVFVDITAYDTNQVLFTFRNTGPEPSAITDVYFDDGALLGIAMIIDSDDGTGGNSGVDFLQFATPSDLPAGELLWPPFVTTEAFSADADPPVSRNGVDPGESLGIVFDLYENHFYEDVLADLISGNL